MGSHKSHKHFTVMVVPHSESAVFTFRLPIGVLQVLTCFVAVFWVALLVFMTSYLRVLDLTSEVADLRAINREQRTQIQFVLEETASLRKRVASIATLERELLSMVDLDLGSEESSDNQLRESELYNQTSEPAVGGESFQVASRAGYQPLTDAYVARAELQDMTKEMERQQSLFADIREALLEQQAYLAARPSTWPVPGIISSSFGYRRSPFGWYREFHHGIDIAAPSGTPITAPAEGKVVYAGWKQAYGLMITIEHGHGFTTAYGHCSKLAVSVGDEVVRGQVIGFVGSTGRSTGPHLHYEARVDGEAVDPRPYLNPAS